MLDRDAVARWLWHPTNVAARLARVPLLPFTGAYAAWVRGRAGAYACGLARARDPGIPVIAVGNLSLGGTGKTPLASWIARHCLGLGVRPGIVLRGYGADEATLHAERVPQAIVVTGRDRYEAVRRAAGLGAEVAVLDDGFQRLDVARRLDVLLVSAESVAAPPWLLPAGPWREAWSAARRADLVVVTTKCAATGPVCGVIARLQALGISRAHLAVAELRLVRLTELDTGRPVPLAALRGSRVLVACAIADPASFARQLADRGAVVRLATWSDHHAFGARDLDRLATASRGCGYVVVTHKDAVKLAGRLPPIGIPVLVAHLEVRWRSGRDRLARRMTGLLTGHPGPAMYSTPHADRITA